MVDGDGMDSVWLTSVAFSSLPGNKNILAAGRSDGSIILTSVHDGLPRFRQQQPHSVTCLSWRPCCMPRPSRNPHNSGIMVETEDLVVGDETGALYYYLVEWPRNWEVSRDTWRGSICLVAKISLHSQQVCGLAWSPGGQLFASGGNDNLCYLYEASQILGRVRAPDPDGRHARLDRWASGTTDKTSHRGVHGATQSRQTTAEAGIGPGRMEADVNAAQVSLADFHHLGPGCETQLWIHRAAVKAIAFCPWRDGLVATGGGSNDRCIHFFHTSSGSALATIAVAAQVTSLIWSTTRREIAATFGYAQPDHCYRVAVFSWPECQQVAAIPWEGELRALYAIPYPWRGDARGSERRALASEGCIVVASSDETVKFHELWPGGGPTAVARSRMLGGSDILEDLDGVLKEDDVIR